MTVLTNDDVRNLVRDDEVHRDLYISPKVFELEMEHLWPSSWIYLGHDSQVPEPGDYVSVDIAREPLIMVRDRDGSVCVVRNRCAHKGTKLVTAPSGKLGAAIRCPYHGWTYGYDGSFRAFPLPKGYAGTRIELKDETRGALGLSRVDNLVNYRGFVFVRLSDHGLSFEDYFGESLTSIDNMVDRAPEGRLEIAGGVLRYMHNCNWKMFVENLNDTMHPMVAHQSSAGTAKSLWYAEHDKDDPKPMVVEQFEPFVNGYEFFDDMGVRTFDHGHSYSGVHFSIHSNYSAVPGYFESLCESLGEKKAKEVLGTNRHNTVYYPSLTIKGAIQAIRVARPMAHDRTLIESWTFRLVGASDEHLKRTLTYSRIINAPTSVVGHDDLQCYRAIQEGLASAGRDWISLHRGYSQNESNGIAGDYNGTNEVSMRGQYRAWRDQILSSMEASHG